MRQTNVKSDRVAALLDELTARTGETKVGALERALGDRLQRLDRAGRLEQALAWLERDVWRHLPPAHRERSDARAER
jgi:hypothetical protein